MATTLDTSFQFYYKTEKAVPIPDIVMSLQALEKVIHESIPVINELIPGCELNAIDVYVDEITTGSLLDDLDLHLVFGSEEGRRKFFEKFRKVTGIDTMNEKMPLLGPIILAVLLLGGTTAITKMFGSDAPRMHIEGDNNTIINICAEHLETEPEVIVAALDKVKNKSHLASNTCKAFFPAKADPNGSIQVDGNDKLLVSAPAIREVPNRMTRIEPEKGTEVWKGQHIVVRAMDLDDVKKGWACVVPSIADERIKMEVAPGVDPTTLLKTDGVFVDLEADFKFTADSDKVYTIVRIQKFVSFDEMMEREKHADTADSAD